MQCSECRFDNPGDSRFCQSCGVPLTRRCASCGHGNVPDARFCGGCGAALDVVAPQSSEPATPEAERRQLTVLFCDLVGSTALSARLDPEDMRDVLRAYQDACSGAITRYDGFVAKFMGDGVFSYFGYPTAHEDDAERAIHAGLGIIAAIGALDHDLAVRIGIATGTVAVGDIVGEGASEEAAIVGEAPNLAARLQEIAEPDTVVIGEATHLLAGRLFETSDLGRRELKGFADPVGAWAVHRSRPATSRFEVIHDERLSELVGREEEVNVLRRRWERTMAGEGQVVLVSGEPGIGKSRIAHTIRQHVAGDDTYYRTFQCSPHHTNSAMFPFIEQVRHDIGLTAEETNDESLAKLEAWIRAADQAPEEIAPVFGPALGIDTSARWPAPTVSPQRQKEILLEAFSRRLKNLAARQPVLYLVEDAHWIDPTSLELMGLHIERTRGIDRVLFVITYRPEFEAPWVGQPHTTLLTLNRLDRSQCAALAASVGGEQPLSEAVIRQIADRTDGVPLFVEELTKAIVESGGQADGQESPFAAVPATLQDALEARLDRLGEARDLAQIGAVIGRSFGHDLLARVSGLDDVELGERLDQLVRSELISARGDPPDSLYTFKHALVQDTAYGTMLRSKRAELHARIAETLESHFPDRVELAPEALAHHFTEAGLLENGAAYWHKAGEAAFDRSALREATAHLEKGIEVATHLPDGPRQIAEEGLHATLGVTHRAAKGPGHEDGERALSRAYELGGHREGSPYRFPVLFGLWQVHYARAQHVQAARETEQLMEFAKAGGDRQELLAANWARGTSMSLMGENLAGLECYDRMRELYDHETDTSLASKYYIEFGVGMHWVASTSLFALGYPDQALQAASESIARARTQLPVHLGGSMIYGTHVPISRGDGRTTFDWADECIAFVEERGLRYHAGFSKVNRGWAFVQLGKVDDGIAEIRDGIKIWRESGLKTWAARHIILLAQSNLIAGRPEEALELAQEALNQIRETAERQFESLAHSALGEALLASKKSDEAEQSYLDAIRISQSQSAKSWELRAATHLARLWHSQGKTAEARDLLAPVYGWFTEGFDTADLKDATALLDEIG